MFSSNQLDPLVASEVMELLGSAHYDVNNPRKLNQIRDIVTYFKDKPNHRYQILKVLSNKSGDKLDILWTYVALQNEKASKTKSLDPELFEADVATELTQGYVSQEKIDQVKENIAQLRAERKAAAKAEKQEQKQKEKAISDLGLELIDDTLTDLSFINKELQAYE